MIDKEQRKKDGGRGDYDGYDYDDSKAPHNTVVLMEAEVIAVDNGEAAGDSNAGSDPADDYQLLQLCGASVSQEVFKGESPTSGGASCQDGETRG